MKGLIPMKKTGFIRSASAVAILGLSLSMGGVTVVAQEPAPGAAAPAAVIDENAPVTLTIDKRLNPTSIGEAGSGTADQAATGNPLKGATFTGVLLNVENVKPQDLGKLTAENWAGLGATKTQTEVTGTTGENGQYTFDSRGTNFQQGIWLFTETITDGVTDITTGKTYKASDVAPSTPFIVSLPYTNADGNGWNYNVTVKPKNKASGITKKVVDADKNVGDTIEYVVSGDVPVIPQGETLQRFHITDTLDTENLEQIQAQVALSDGTPLADGDYTLTVDQGSGEVALNITNLEKLSRLAAGTTVDLTITAKVKELEGTDGIAINKARQFVHYPNQDKETETESNEVKSYWGQVKVVKTEEGTNTPLKDAEFELYRCNGDEQQADQLNDKISINGTSKWTTNEQGNVIIDGIHVTDIENDSDAINKHYCLVETKAPRGFVATSEVHSFQLASNDERLNQVTPVQYEAQIKNKRSEMPQLPLTGGMGIGLLAALAALVAGLAAWFARRASSKA